MQDEIIKLQELLSYQSHELAQLSDVVYAQSKEIDNLQRQLSNLKNELETLRSEGSEIKSATQETKPPHY
jgi:uncharacterized coiled-coil protein SlyX